MKKVRRKMVAIPNLYKALFNDLYVEPGYSWINTGAGYVLEKFVTLYTSRKGQRDKHIEKIPLETKVYSSYRGVKIAVGMHLKTRFSICYK